MKKIAFLSLVLFSITVSAQKKPKKKADCMKAVCQKLLESPTQVEYGTPLCIEVEGVNNFLTKSFSKYTPINFDFSTSTFEGINIDDMKPTNKVNESFTKNLSNINERMVENKMQISSYSKQIMILESLKSGIVSDSIKDNEIEKLTKKIEKLNSEKESLENSVKELTKKNNQLQNKFDSIHNISIKTAEFILEFKKFQSHFANINNYISLKDKLLNLIKKDSVFICDKENFKERCSSSFIAIYGSKTDYLIKKELLKKELSNLDESYIKLVSIYQQINKLYKNNELKLSGELKDGKTSFKFDKITASIETKYLFEDEMKKVKAINEGFTNQENIKKMINEVYEGIDLFNEILTNDYKTYIISENIYDDIAEITPQLKNSKGKVMYEYRKFKVSSYGNIKVNGSAGYFLNFISDDNFTLRKKINSDPNSKTGIEEGNKNSLKHSLGGLLHAYYNCKGGVDFGLSVGLSINDSTNAGFYVGLSGFVTESNRLVITSGLSFVKVKRLNKYNLNINETSKQLDFTNEEDTEIRYDEVYKPSFFFGLSYNLF